MTALEGRVFLEVRPRNHGTLREFIPVHRVLYLYQPADVPDGWFVVADDGTGRMEHWALLEPPV